MKKFFKFLVLIIFIVIILFGGYKFFTTKNKKNVNKNDYSDLKKYIKDIYGTTFLIPEFKNINDADEDWLWENVNQYVWNHDDEYKEKNNQQYGYTYEDVSKIVKILYGDNLNKKFPKGSVSMRYDSYNDLYGPTSYGITNYYDYKIDKITQKENTYTISLYDYTVSIYSSFGDETNNNQNYVIYNNYDYLLNLEDGTPIISIESLKDKEFENLLDKKDLLSHKILTIEYNPPTNEYYIKACKYEGTTPENILANSYYEMKQTFEIYSIDYNRDDIYSQDEVLVNNFDELSSIYTENSINTYKEEMDLFVFKDNGETYITAGDIDVGEYLVKTEFKDVEASENRISSIAIRTFRESWNPSDEEYNKTYQKEDKFTIIKKDGKWYIDEFNYNNLS